MAAYLRMIEDKERYGRGLGIAISIGLHVLVLGGLAWFGHAGSDDYKPPPNAMQVKLGGPPKIELSGKSRKAPVAGVARDQPRPRPKPKTPPVKKPAPPKPSRNDVGLNREEKKPEKKDPPKTVESEAPAKTESAPAPTPPPPKRDQRDQKALGGIDGSDGTGVGVEVGDGSEDLDVEDLEFISYFKQVQAQIARNWVRSSATGAIARVRFHIHRDGTVSEVTVVKSTGRGYLDGPAKRAVLASEFPPLPQGYLGEKLIVNINFNYGAAK